MESQAQSASETLIACLTVGLVSKESHKARELQDLHV